MTNAEFIRLVEQMRDAQKRYFKTRDNAIISESKRLEHKVDEAIRELKDGQQKLPLG